MAKRSGLDTSILETSVPNIPESPLMIACHQITSNLIGSKIQSDYGSVVSVRGAMHLVGKLFNSSESNEVSYSALASLSSLSMMVTELRSESRETQNVLKRALESRDHLVNLMIQMIKSSDCADDDLLADFSSRTSSKLLDLAKILGCMSLLTGDDFEDEEIEHEKLKQAFQQGFYKIVIYVK